MNDNSAVDLGRTNVGHAILARLRAAGVDYFLALSLIHI